MKIKCVIVDDDEGQIELLERELKAFPEFSVVKKYSDPRKFLSDAPDLHFDLAFLDIDMGALKGTEVSTMLRKPVIFVSAHRKEYSEELQDLFNKSNNIIQTLNKAGLSNELKSAVPEIIKRLSHRNGTIALRCLGEDRNFLQSEIVLVTTMPEGHKERRDMRLLKIKNGKPGEGEWVTIKNTRLEAIMDKLNPDLFFRLNKSCIVSRNSVETRINSDEVHLRIPANITDLPKYQSIGDGLNQAFKDWLGR